MAGSFILNDLDGFLNENEFADSVIWTPNGGAAQDPISGIFNEGYISVDPETGEDFSINPSVTCKASEVLGIAHKDILMVNSVDYVVLRSEVSQGLCIIEVIEP